MSKRKKKVVTVTRDDAAIAVVKRWLAEKGFHHDDGVDVGTWTEEDEDGAGVWVSVRILAYNLDVETEQEGE